MGQTNVFTATLSGTTLTISGSQNVLRLSVQCNSGTVSFLGSSSFGGLTPTAATFSVGEGVTITAANPSVPLDGITITAATGGDSFDVLISYQ